MSKAAVVIVALLSLTVAACADDQTVKPYKVGERLGESADDDDDAELADEDDDDDSSSTKTTTTKSPTTTKSTALGIDTTSCTGVNEPDVTYASAEPGTLPAATGGTITDGTWILQSAELESAGTAALTEKRRGMIRFSGNRFAWHDTTACLTGTFTTSGANLDLVTEDGTATVTFTVESGGGFTLKRSADEAYHYVKE